MDDARLKGMKHAHRIVALQLQQMTEGGPMKISAAAIAEECGVCSKTAERAIRIIISRRLFTRWQEKRGDAYTYKRN